MIIKQTTPANLNHVFNEIFNSFPASWGSDNRNENHISAVNIYETSEAYLIDVNAPGRNKEDFKISIEKGILTVAFEQKKDEQQKEVKTIKREFGVKSFKRSFSVDEKINTDAIQARYENGILNLTLPKREEVKISPKQIQIL